MGTGNTEPLLSTQQQQQLQQQESSLLADFGDVVRRLNSECDDRLRQALDHLANRLAQAQQEQVTDR